MQASLPFMKSLQIFVLEETGFFHILKFLICRELSPLNNASFHSIRLWGIWSFTTKASAHIESKKLIWGMRLQWLIGYWISSHIFLGKGWMFLLQVLFNLMFVSKAVLFRHPDIWFLLVFVHLSPPLSKLMHYVLELRDPFLHHFRPLLPHENDIWCEYPLRWVISCPLNHSLLFSCFNNRLGRHGKNLIKVALSVFLRQIFIFLFFFRG